MDKTCWKEGLVSLKCKPGRGVKSLLTSEQLSELKKTLSEPIPTDDGYSRGWQTKDVMEFVREKFGISYSESRMRQIIKDLGFSKITCRPRVHVHRPPVVTLNETPEEFHISIGFR